MHKQFVPLPPICTENQQPQTHVRKNRGEGEKGGMREGGKERKGSLTTQETQL